jgi:chromosome segregation ATPase
VSEVHPITFRLKVFNAWRRGNEAPQPDPKTVGEDIDSICDIAKRLEIERDELREHLKSQRALADRLAEAIQNHLELDQNIDATLDELNNAWECLQSSITAWKEARND